MTRGDWKAAWSAARGVYDDRRGVAEVLASAALMRERGPFLSVAMTVYEQRGDVTARDLRAARVDCARNGHLAVSCCDPGDVDYGPRLIVSCAHCGVCGDADAVAEALAHDVLALRVLRELRVKAGDRLS